MSVVDDVGRAGSSDDNGTWRWRVRGRSPSAPASSPCGCSWRSRSRCGLGHADGVGRDRLQSPSASHLLGTDAVGRDVFLRTLYGARDSLPTAAAVIVLTVLIGSALGAVAGFRGGIIESVIMRTSDVVLAFPPIFLAMAVAAALGPACATRWWPWCSCGGRSTPGCCAARYDDQAPRARRGGHVRRRAPAPHPRQARAAPGADAGDDQRHDGLRSGAHLHGVAELPRSRGQAAVTGVGPDDRRRDEELLPVVGLAGPGIAILSVVLAANFLGDGLRDHFDVKSRG